MTEMLASEYPTEESLAKRTRQIDEVLYPQQNVVFAQSRDDRPRRSFLKRTNDVVPVFFDEFAASISVANTHDVVGDLEQDRNGHEHSYLDCPFGLLDNRPTPLPFRVTGHFVQFKQPRGVEDGDVRHDTDSSHCRMAFSRSSP